MFVPILRLLTLASYCQLGSARFRDPALQVPFRLLCSQLCVIVSSNSKNVISLK